MAANAMHDLNAKLDGYIDKLKLKDDTPDAFGVALLSNIGRLLQFGQSPSVNKYRLQVDLKIENEQKADAERKANGGTLPAAKGKEKAERDGTLRADFARIRSMGSSTNAGVSFDWAVVRPGASR